MTRTVIELDREGHLNSLIKNKRSEDFKVLYYSKWDKYSTKVIEYVQSSWVAQKGDETLYIVNSWDLPHSFVAFNVTHVPCMVSSVRGRIRKEEYLPRVWNSLTGDFQARSNRAS